MNEASQIYCQNCGTLLKKGSSFCPFCGSTNKSTAKQKPEVFTPDANWLATYNRIKQNDVVHSKDEDYNAPYKYQNQANTYKSLNAYTDYSYTPSYVGCSSVFEYILFFLDIMFSGCGCFHLMMVSVFFVSFLYLITLK